MSTLTRNKKIQSQILLVKMPICSLNEYNFKSSQNSGVRNQNESDLSSNFIFHGSGCLNFGLRAEPALGEEDERGEWTVELPAVVSTSLAMYAVYPVAGEEGGRLP